MEDIHTTNHRWFRHERQVVNGPWNASDFGVHLDQHLADDRAEILTLGDCTYKNHLGRDGELGEEELLDVIVERALALLTRQ